MAWRDDGSPLTRGRCQAHQMRARNRAVSLISFAGNKELFTAGEKEGEWRCALCSQGVDRRIAELRVIFWQPIQDIRQTQ
jgi:hypothetical protein